MEKRTSLRIFKLIKDEILKLRDEGQVLHTFRELRETTLAASAGRTALYGRDLADGGRPAGRSRVVKELDPPGGAGASVGLRELRGEGFSRRHLCDAGGEAGG